MVSIQRIGDADRLSSGDIKLLAKKKKIAVFESVLETTLLEEHCFELTRNERPLSTVLRTEG